MSGSGVLVLDKPPGITSQGAVARVRRALGIRRVGHAGTLDPMATGVLVVVVGEATKLASHLTAADKSYRASVRLGIATDTLDADGRVTDEEPLPRWWRDERLAREQLDAALEAERRRHAQIPPAHSAIHVAGARAHALARAGEHVDLAARPVAVRSLALLGRDVDGGLLELDLTVSKGYYVRALARDLGAALGVPAHLAALRRTASGCFRLEEATSLERVTETPLLPLGAAARRVLPCATLRPEGVTRARHGQRLRDEDFAAPPDAAGSSAWLDASGELVAIGHARDGGWAVVRGFQAAQPSEWRGARTKNEP